MTTIARVAVNAAYTAEVAAKAHSSYADTAEIFAKARAAAEAALAIAKDG